MAGGVYGAEGTVFVMEPTLTPPRAGRERLSAAF